MRAISICLAMIAAVMFAEEPELMGLPAGTDLLAGSAVDLLKLGDYTDGRGTAEILSVQEAFGKAIRVTVPAKMKTASAVQLKAPLAHGVSKGDVVVLVFQIRSGADGSAESLSLVECNEPSWAGLIVTTARAEGEWKRYFLVGTAKQDFPAGKTTLSFQFGAKQQTADIGGITLINFGTSVVYNATTKKLKPAAEAANDNVNFTVTAGSRWKPIDLDALPVEAGSALDLSRFVDGPAGKYGRVTVAPNGTFAFTARPQKEVRFFAFNALINHLFDHPDVALAGATEEETKANCRAYAALVKRHGYNMIRLHYVDFYLVTGASADYTSNPLHQDRFDYLVHCFKQEGIYFGLDAMSFTGLKRASWREGQALRYKERFLVDSASREVWEKSVRVLMTHVNPYTKMTLADDPAVVYVTHFNEQDLGIYRDNFAGPVLRPLAEERWRDFLSRRYNGDHASLVRNWGDNAAAGDSFSRIPYFEKKDFNASGQRGNDIALFLYTLESEMFTWYDSTLRTIGYKGYASLYDVISFFRHHSIHNDASVVLNHGYHALPTDGERPGSKVQQDSAVGTAVSYWRSRAAARLLNRPFLITEYGSPYWGRFRHEEGLFYASYSALQKQSAITVHEQAVAFRTQPLRECYYGRDPIGRASQVMAAFLYQRGDVTPSPHTVAVVANDTYTFTNGAAGRTVNSEQSKIALLCGFGIQYEKKFPAGLPPYPKPDLMLLPGDGGDVAITGEGMGGMANVIDKGDGSDLTRIISLLKSKGVLSAENRSSAAKDIYQSDTQELTLSVLDGQFTVITPRTEGAILKENAKTALNSVRLISTTIPAAVAVISLDEAPLAESKRMLLIYSTDAANTGLETSPDRVTLVKHGTLPILVETGTVKVAVKNAAAASMKCHALGMNGQRREMVPLRESPGDEIRILIDTGALAKGPALFFELAAD